MAATRLQPLELGRRQARRSRSERWASAIFAVVAFGAVAAVLAVFFADRFGDYDPARLRDLAGRIGEGLRQAPAELAQLALIPVAAVLHLWYTRRTMKYERLYLDATGLRYRSPLPERLRFLQPDWSLQWPQVRAARLIVPRFAAHPQVAALELDAGTSKRKVPHVPLWAVLAPSGEAVGEERPSWRPRFFGARDREELVGALEASPLVRYLRQAGVALTVVAPSGAEAGYSLESHRQALIAALAVLLLLGYAVLDLAINKESYVAEPPLVIFALAGAVVALAGMLWLHSAGVPRAETLGVSLLLGGAAAFALYPGLLRLNQATDADGLRSYDYRLTAYVVFSPMDPRVPELKFPKDLDYWGQFKLGTTHSFELRKGAFGFYQVDMGPVHERMRAYFTGSR